MQKDITMEIAQFYRNEAGFGDLISRIPPHRPHNLHLEKLYGSILRSKFFDETLKPEQIQCVVLFGDVLYRNTPIQTKIEHKRLAGFIGKKETIEKHLPLEKPRAYEILVVTKGKVKNNNSSKEKHHPLERRVAGCATSKELVRAGRAAFYSDRNIPVNIYIREEEEFISGVKQEQDKECLQAHKEGIPIFESNYFFKLLKKTGMEVIPRLHEIDWHEDVNGQLFGFVDDTTYLPEVQK